MKKKIAVFASVFLSVLFIIGGIYYVKYYNSIKEIKIELEELLEIENRLNKEINFSPTPKLLIEEDYIRNSLNFNNL